MFGELGLKPHMQYFASRSAPMGVVTAKVVAATFYNFNPELIAQAIPAAWDVASPEAVTGVRYQIVDATLPKILEKERVSSPKFAHSTGIVRRTAEAIPNADGRPLYAGHAELDWPGRRTPSCGMRSPCCASIAVTAISRRWLRRAQRHRGTDHPCRDGNGLRSRVRPTPDAAGAASSGPKAPRDCGRADCSTTPAS